MELFRSLDNELEAHPGGKWAISYARFVGMRDHFADPPAIMRAYGIKSLLAYPDAYIDPSELIAGNDKRYFSKTLSDAEINDSDEIVKMIGKRKFMTNNDHYAPYYDRVLEVGVVGLIADIDASITEHAGDSKKTEYLSAMRLTLEGLNEMISKYERKADEMIGTPGYSDDRLRFIRDNCAVLTKGAPTSFASALQLIWFIHSSFVCEGRYAMALGRLDKYLYPFYKKDSDAGRITDAEVVELLENVFIRLKKDICNICIGGTNTDGSCAVNELSYLIIDAVRECNIPGPNLSARITDDTPDDFLDAALVSVGTGLGYPALMNDRVNMTALRRYGYDEDDICGYSMVGCIENFMTGRQPPWSDSRFDTPLYLDAVFNGGVGAFSGKIGADTGKLDNIKTMDDFLAAYKAQLRFAAEEHYARFRAKNESISQEYYPEPFLSCFCFDCIGRGLDINAGGAKYPSVHGVGAMGIATVTDSLAAVEKVVFTDHAATLAELRDALNANFDGYEDLRKLLLAAPKYGNNDDFADKYAVWFVDTLSEMFSGFRTRDGGWIYIAMASNTSNIDSGRITGATPDGRKAGEPLSDAASPTYGRDIRGCTATMHSIAKPDYTKVATGSVVNQKYSPSMFESGKREKLSAMIRTYFKNGGQEIQINATSPETLRDAMEHPENYKSLVVRVSGFSAFYVQLDRDVQIDILNRTQKDF